MSLFQMVGRAMRRVKESDVADHLGSFSPVVGEGLCLRHLT